MSVDPEHTERQIAAMNCAAILLNAGNNVIDQFSLNRHLKDQLSLHGRLYGDIHAAQFLAKTLERGITMGEQMIVAHPMLAEADPNLILAIRLVKLAGEDEFLSATIAKAFVEETIRLAGVPITIPLDLSELTALAGTTRQEGTSRGRQITQINLPNGRQFQEAPGLSYRPRLYVDQLDFIARTLTLNMMDFRFN